MLIISNKSFEFCTFYPNYERKLIEKDDPKLSRKRKVSGHYKEGEGPVKFLSKVEEYYCQFILLSN